MAGERAINQVSDIFAELSESAKLAAVELFKLAGKADAQANKSQSLYQKMTKVFSELVEPLANLSATVTGVVSGFGHLAALVPGVKVFWTSLEGVRKIMADLAGVAGIVTRNLAQVGAGLVKIGADILTTKTSLALFDTAGKALAAVAGMAAGGLKALGGSLATLAPNLSKALGQGFEGFGKGLSSLVRQLGALGPPLLGFAQLVGKVVSGLLGITANLAGAFANAAAWTSRNVTAFGQALMAMPSKVLPALTASLSSMGGAMLGPLTGLIQSAINPLGTLKDLLAPFFNALSPGLMEQLNLAFNDLMAVVGRALTPVMGALIPIVRLFADAMVPVANALLPVFNSLAQVLLNLASGIIPVLSGVVMAVIPYAQALADNLAVVSSQFGQALIPIIDALLPLTFAFYDAFAQLVPAMASLVGAVLAFAVPIINWVVPKLVMALRWLTDTIVAVVNYLRSWVLKGALALGGGGNGGPQNFKLGQVAPGASAMASTRGANWMGIGELGRSMAAATFGAGITPEMKTAENTAQMVQGINQLVQGQQNANQNQNKFQGNQPAQGVR
jgi:phage-related protein